MTRRSSIVRSESSSDASRMTYDIRSRFIQSVPMVRLSLFNRRSVFDEQINCIKQSDNQRDDKEEEDDHHHQHRVSRCISNPFWYTREKKAKGYNEWRQFDMPKSKLARFLSLSPSSIIYVCVSSFLSLSLYCTYSVTLHTQILVSSSSLHQLLF